MACPFLPSVWNKKIREKIKKEKLQVGEKKVKKEKAKEETVRKPKKNDKNEKKEEGEPERWWTGCRLLSFPFSFSPPSPLIMI